MENQLSLILNKSGLEAVKKEYILQQFNEFSVIAEEWETRAKQIVVKEEYDTDTMKLAKEGRLFLVKKRGDIERVRKQLKEQSLREGQTIDAVARGLKLLIEPIEEYLESQEKYADLLEQKRKEERKIKRLELLKPFEETENFFSLNHDLLNMSDEAFNNLFSGTKLNYKAKKEAERKAEKERIAKEKAEAEEREKMKLENEKLKAEAIERERLLAEQKAKSQAIEKELKQKKEAEEIRLAQIEKDKKAELLAEKKIARQPYKKKLESFAGFIQAIEMPELKSEEAKKIVEDVQTLLNKITDFIYSKTESL